MTGKSTIGQHLTASKFAALKCFIVSSDEDDSDTEVPPQKTNVKKKPVPINSDSDEDGDNDENTNEKPAASPPSKKLQQGSQNDKKIIAPRPKEKVEEGKSTKLSQETHKNKTQDVCVSSEGEEESFHDSEDDGNGLKEPKKVKETKTIQNQTDVRRMSSGVMEEPSSRAEKQPPSQSAARQRRRESKLERRSEFEKSEGSIQESKESSRMPEKQEERNNDKSKRLLKSSLNLVMQ